MKIKIKNKTYKLRPWAEFVLYALCIGIVFLCVLPFVKDRDPKNPNSNQPYSTIVIDAGHGSIDSGTIGTDQTLEKDMTLKYAKELGKQIQAINPNFKVYYTRTNDTLDWVEDDSPQFELDDLNGRVKFSNDIRPDFFISIHFNAISDASVHGYSGFIKTDDEIMQNIYNSIDTNLQKNNWSKNLGIHTTAERPLHLVEFTEGHSMLFEVGFLSSPDELSQLKEKETQSMICKAVAKAYCDQVEKMN